MLTSDRVASRVENPSPTDPAAKRRAARAAKRTRKLALLMEGKKAAERRRRQVDDKAHFPAEGPRFRPVDGIAGDGLGDPSRVFVPIPDRLKGVEPRRTPLPLRGKKRPQSKKARRKASDIAEAERLGVSVSEVKARRRR